MKTPVAPTTMLQERDRRFVARRAFTLVEVLLSLAMIAVLAILLIPISGRMRIAAQDAKCKANLGQIAVGVQQYLQDHNFIFFPHKVTKDENGNDLADWLGWYGSSYLGAYFPKSEYPLNNAVKRRIPWCPELDRDPTKATKWAATGYGYNTNFAQKSYWSIKEPAKTVLLWEDSHEGNNWYGGQPTKTGGSWYTFAFRHGDKANLLFVDGHVEVMHKVGENPKTKEYPEYIWTQ